MGVTTGIGQAKFALKCGSKGPLPGAAGADQGAVDVKKCYSKHGRGKIGPEQPIIQFQLTIYCEWGRLDALGSDP